MGLPDLHGATLRAYHDSEGWCIRAEWISDEPFDFGCYAATARDAQWAAEQVAAGWGHGCSVEPLRLN